MTNSNLNVNDDKYKKSLKKRLEPLQYRVLVKQATERPFSGKFVHNKKTGTYDCAACGNPLFSSDAKFESGTGWPSFDKPVTKNAIRTRVDDSHGMRRTEVVCGRCGGHLGHLFMDGPTETKCRYCINSASLGFEEKTPKDDASSKQKALTEKTIRLT